MRIKKFLICYPVDILLVCFSRKSGMREALMQNETKSYEDIIALVALYRPGPMANIPTYNDCKHGRQKPDYLHQRRNT